MTSVHFVFRQREFVRPCPHRDRDYRMGSDFWKFYRFHIELVSLVRVVFRLFRLEQIVFVLRVQTQ